jgi:DNA ligase (NAD+)
MKSLRLLRLLPVFVPTLLTAFAQTVPDPREQIAALRREVARHDALYHRQVAPEISDAAYDQLKRTLIDLERSHPEAAKSVPPVPAIGDDRSGTGPTRRHRVPMLSLDKTHSVAELRAFHSRLVQRLGEEDLAYVIEPKVDGLAVSVTYERGRLKHAVTRGDGAEGDDITAAVRRLPGVPEELKKPPAGEAWPEVMEVRGEIYVPWAEFERVNAEREQAGTPRSANPRNLAAGTVRQADGRDVAARGLRVVFFGVGAWVPEKFRPATQTAWCEAMRRWGLPGLEERWTARGPIELERVIDDLRRGREKLPYPTDGAVVKLDAVAQQRELGESEVAPRWAVAYKFAPDRVETQVRAITVQVGRTGVLTPVAELAPVEVGGATVTRATLHNAEEIVRRDIRVGDVVLLEKAGDVIPAIVGVNRERRPATAAPYEFPRVCPSCFAPVVRHEGAVARRCSGGPCPAQLQRRLEHFASKAGVDIDGLGPATIETLVGQGWLRDLPDLYRLRRADLLSLGQSNERSVDRLLAAIERSKRAELWRVIHGLGLPQVGAATAKDLARQCGSLVGLAELGPRAVSALAEARYQDLIADLIAVGVEPVAPGGEGGRVSGKTFVLTGALPNLSRTVAAEKIEAAGGRVSGSVHRSTGYIVVGRDPGEKRERARALGVPELDEPALVRLLEGR